MSITNLLTNADYYDVQYYKRTWPQTEMVHCQTVCDQIDQGHSLSVYRVCLY